MALIDLSHPVEHGMGMYWGFPPPSVRHHIGYGESAGQIVEGREFCIDLITVIGASGTYMDAPRHFDHDGVDIAALPLERLVEIPAVVVPAPADSRREYQPCDLVGLDVEGCAVLLATGWDRRWGTPAYATGSPYLGGAAAHQLVDAGAVLVGIDALLIDDVDDEHEPRREAHSSLLAARIPIIENMTRLASLPERGARVTAVPPPMRDVGSFPVRVFAQIA